MKYLIALFIFSTSLSAFAHLSSADPVVGALKKQFIDGQAPTDDQIRSAKTYGNFLVDCKWVDSRPGVSRNGKIDYLLLGDGLYEVDRPNPKTTTNSPAVFVITKEGLTSTFPLMDGKKYEGRGQLVFRVVKSNSSGRGLKLIAEWSIRGPAPKAFEPAVAFPGSQAVAYGSCDAH